MKQRCLFPEAAVVCRSRVSCQPNYKYSSAKLSLNSVLSLSKAIGTSTKLSSNNVLYTSKVIRTSARLSSTIIHSLLSTGSCSEKNPTAKLYHKTRSKKMQSISLLFICAGREQKPSL
ncbi:hypothetical protein ACFX12_000957 [Malus domestica]